jgi:tRNA dimethylallyltransferase
LKSSPSVQQLPPNTFIVLGPTAVGKSELAVELAERVHGEIVGADAFQVYSGLDTLSAKPSSALRARVPHHLIGVVPLSASFDVAQYRAMAMECIAEIAGRGKTPIICGGAGMYVRALTHGLAETPPADAELRAKLAEEPLESLVQRLRDLDPASTVDEANPRRVIRALEVCILSGRPFSSFRTEWTTAPGVRGVILTRSRESLEARITARTAAMFTSGVLEEVEVAAELGPTAEKMLGLREIQGLLKGKFTRQECKERIIIATRRYAKRQMTWFRREQGYVWLDLDVEKDSVTEMLRVAEFRSA